MLNYHNKDYYINFIVIIVESIKINEYKINEYNMTTLTVSMHYTELIEFVCRRLTPMRQIYVESSSLPGKYVF